jgi:hypothetical protein
MQRGHTDETIHVIVVDYFDDDGGDMSSSRATDTSTHMTTTIN